MTDPLEGLLAGLGDASVEDDQVFIEVDGLPEEDRSARWLAYVGMFDLLAEESLSRVPVEERQAYLTHALARVRAVEGPLKFALHEQRSEIDACERAARMREKNIAMTDGWLLPKLREDIDSYGRHIEALRRALEEQA